MQASRCPRCLEAFFIKACGMYLRWTIIWTVSRFLRVLCILHKILWNMGTQADPAKTPPVSGMCQKNKGFIEIVY
jgi:hypothetical protein